MLNTDFLQRRKKLLASMEKDAIVIIPAAMELIRNGDVHFSFRQDSYFYYLTGFSEPDAVAVFAPGHELGEFILFNRSYDKEREIWDGKRVGQEGAVQQYVADKAYPIEKIAEYLPTLLANRKKIYYPLGKNKPCEEWIMHAMDQLQAQARKGVNSPEEFCQVSSIIDDMRLIKSPYEQELMREAAHISAQAHLRAMQKCQPELYEYQLAAEIHYHFSQHACHTPAYPTIVGGGANACTLHYVHNNQQLKNGDLVLIDAGGEYHNYAADITRTFPVNGKFSPQQKLLYEIVLSAQKAAIAKAMPGASWSVMQETAVEILTEGLVALGILRGNVKELIATKAYRQFYMHNCGHWLGLDTHDVGNYKINDNWQVLQPGMVLTVEPGLYIQPADNVDAKWWNIGIRIEDDILITATANEVLSARAPKEMDELEACIGIG